MSYDIWVESKRCEHCGRGPTTHGDWNYTSNMARAWRAAGADLADFHDKPAGECAEVLARGIAAMEADLARFREFDAPNKWGTMETLLPALRDLLATLQAMPTGTVKVWR